MEVRNLISFVDKGQIDSRIDGPLSQSRKQAIRDKIQKDRRRNRIITIAVALGLIAVILIAVYIETRPGKSQFTFPCLGHESFAMHIHPNLQITINNASVSVPAYIGTVGAPPC